MRNDNCSLYATGGQKRWLKELREKVGGGGGDGDSGGAVAVAGAAGEMAAGK